MFIMLKNYMEERDMVDVLCMGHMAADVVAKTVTDLPEKGKLVLVDEIELHSGGCATNTGNALAKLGIDTKIIGRVGNDSFGNFLIDKVKEFGVNASNIVRDKGISTSVTFVTVDENGERTFLHYLGANGQLKEKDISYEILKGTKILHIAGALLLPSFDGKPASRVLKMAKDMGITTSLDTCWDSTGGWLNKLEPCLYNTDIFLPSIEEAKMISGLEDPSEIANFFLGYGIKIVCIKMGSKGAYLKTAEKDIRIPVFRVKAIDSTGAGDAFVAGFLTGVIKGMNLEDVAKLASALGAFCVQSMGASTGIRTWDDTVKFIKTTPLLLK